MAVNDFASPLRLQAAAVVKKSDWPTDAELEALRDRFLVAATEAEQMRIAGLMQARAMQVVPHVTIGQMWQPTAFRQNVQDIPPSPVPLFWNVRKG